MSSVLRLRSSIGGGRFSFIGSGGKIDQTEFDMSREITGQEAWSVNIFYRECDGDFERARKCLMMFKKKDVSEESITEICRIFFSDTQKYISLAQEYERSKAEADRVAEETERARKKEDYVRQFMPSQEVLTRMALKLPLSICEARDACEISLRGLSAFSRFKTTPQLHFFMMRYNWDNGLEAVRWIASSNLCDKGTALICAWRTDCVADAFLGKGDEYAKDHCDLVLDIHSRWKQGFYKETIRFDPRNDAGHDWTVGRPADYFPGMDPSFLGPSPGAEYDW